MNARTIMAQREDIIKRIVYVTEEQFAGLFVNCGQVVDCRICGDLNSVLRFAFIEFTDEVTGSIPESLGTLSSLSAMSLNDNQLSRELPDVFQNLAGLINLDISANNLSGTLPPSMENLSALTTLCVQNNQLSGTLDVLQGLPLQNLIMSEHTLTQLIGLLERCCEAKGTSWSSSSQITTNPAAGALKEVPMCSIRRP